MSGYLLEAVVGLVVWLVANVVYLDLVRSGGRGFRRLLAFWFGMPTTLLMLLFVRRGSAPRIEPPPDDVDALLAEVRRDRWLREKSGEERRVGPGDDPSGDSQPHTGGAV